MAQLVERLSGMYEALGLSVSTTQDPTWWRSDIPGTQKMGARSHSKPLLATSQSYTRQWKIYIFKKDVNVSWLLLT